MVIENMSYDTKTVTGGSVCKAVLQYCANSHPFEERTLSLDQPVKIGRLLAKAWVSPNNGIFDCKVLSRNHALLWHENGKFFLQDTKSSNGTFVNNHRLSKSGEESQPQEVFSGDIVQFGVDVIENSKNISHGCITAVLKLYHADGTEAESNPVVNFINDVCTQDLYNIDAYIRDAIHREANLENKLLNLERLLSNIIGETDNSWKALITEDRLLSKIEFLESQLQYYKKDYGEDEIKQEICDLKKYKYSYQGLAKDCLKKEMEEKLKMMQRCQELESLLKHSTVEQNALMKHLNNAQDEIKEMCTKFNTELANHENSVKEFDVSKDLYETELKKLKEEKNELELSFHSRCEEVERLRAEIAKMNYEINTRNVLLLTLQNEHELTEDISLNKYFNDIMSYIIHVLQDRQTYLNQINSLQSQMQKHIKQKADIENQVCQLQTELDFNRELLVNCIKNKNVSDIDNMDPDQLKMIILNEDGLKNIEDLSKDHEIQSDFYKQKCDDIEFKLTEAKDILLDCINNLDDQESTIKLLKKELSCKDIVLLLMSNYLCHLSNIDSNNINDVPDILQKNLNSFNDLKSIDTSIDLEVFKTEFLNNVPPVQDNYIIHEVLPDSQTNGYSVREISSETIETKEDSALDLKELEQIRNEYDMCFKEKNDLKYELEQTMIRCKELEQTPNFHLFFALPSIVLFLVLVIRFYSYLSYLTGTTE
ncbi:sarcolemmal membrane-associated protein [Sipha flava]|jgi:pSer/pThr/pTyr-binding forkhead associated (FHA) protein|uniref:Sarcolemmal membrane-associated protein n=1 Tax=Sipha flava TaxID=143950 RepID=A0A8B8GRT1_9HEMI|nr:sarcolemmal membrane-associated protein [Sipha flava]